MPSRPLDTSQALRLAFSHSQAGRNKQAKEICRKILAAEPRHAGANYLLGVILSQAGKMEPGIRLIQNAIKYEPANPWAHIALGNALKKNGDLSGAIQSYKKAISINPKNPDACFNLGNTFKQQGDLSSAAVFFKKAIALKPDFARAYNNLANVLKEQGRLKEAVANYKKALSFVPEIAELHHNLANTLNLQGNLEEAVTCYKKAISLKPRYPEAYNGLGDVLLSQGRIADAVYSLQKALEMDAEYCDALNNLGNASREQGNLQKARQYYTQALHIKPGDSIAHSNLLFLLNYMPGISQGVIYQESLKFAEAHRIPKGKNPPFSPRKQTGKTKLKIGYVSPDFRSHSVSYFLRPLLEAHNRNDFEIFCYSDVRRADTMTKRLESASDHWHVITGKGNKAVAETINKHGIDILVDLAGHTANNRLLVFARKPAPIQVTWLGYPNTTGLREIDYRFTDTIADPPGDGDAFYSEELIRLPKGFLCYRADDSAPEVSPVPSLLEGHITFGSMNNTTKVVPEVAATWAQILIRVPNSRLLLKAKQLADETIRSRYLKMFAHEGISPDRIILQGMLPSIADHLAMYSRIDIALDPYPYNGTTTTCESLWMGVPVITMRGDRHAGRVGASILYHMGLAESLVADNINSYVQQAVRLANDRGKLAEFRAGLRGMMQNSPLCDAPSFARQVEEAYWQMRTKQEQI